MKSKIIQIEIDFEDMLNDDIIIYKLKKAIKDIFFIVDIKEVKFIEVKNAKISKEASHY